VSKIKTATEMLDEKCRGAKEASRRLAYVSTEVKNRALEGIAWSLSVEKDRILAANKTDLDEARATDMGTALLDRLLLTSERLEAMAADVRAVAALPDPVGEVWDMRTLPNGLTMGRKRVPLGVIGVIYESRPNVTVDVASLCLKAGNAVILRGGKEALHSNLALAAVVREAACTAGLPEGCIQFINNTDRELVSLLLGRSDTIDLMIPRGGAGLIKFVRENAAMPVVAGGIGVCHTYIDREANIEKAVTIAHNAKVQRPTVCNALDSLLVHAEIAASFLPLLAGRLASAGVELHADQRAISVLKNTPSLKLKPATEEDWGKEFLSLTIAIKVVGSLDEALAHIAAYGSGHSEAIVTESYGAAMRFLNEVDAACVYANASTRFTDGAQFGLGAELGISTQKMHARGPLGLREITSYKWIIFGSGQVRP
jgi:glutamate-5-semialdehyde dehydrogenase